MTDQPVFNHINDLADEEERLWLRAAEGDGLEGRDQRRLQEIQVELDQCYDLLAQRRARRAGARTPTRRAFVPPTSSSGTSNSRLAGRGAIRPTPIPRPSRSGT
jgi:Protein of unknown function (DUF2630)